MTSETAAQVKLIELGLDRGQAAVDVNNEEPFLAGVGEHRVAIFCIVGGGISRIETVMRRQVGDQQVRIDRSRDGEREVAIRQVVQGIFGQ
jgi:hypothetical protein